MMGLPFVVFDCDGTLVDSLRGIVVSAFYAFDQEGLPRPDEERIRHSIGLPIEVAIVHMAPQEEVAQDPDRIARLSALFRDASLNMKQSAEFDEPLYDGALDAIDSLLQAGCLLGIATGKGRRGLNITLEKHNLTKAFTVLKTVEDGPGKPNPKILLDAMMEAGAAPASTLMLGDTSFDMEMARAAQTYAAGVSWGYHPRETLMKSGANTILTRYQMLPALAKSVLSL